MGPLGPEVLVSCCADGKGLVGCTSLGGGGHDNREVEEVADGGVGENIVAVLLEGLVTDQLEESDLNVDDQESGIGLVQAIIGILGVVVALACGLLALKYGYRDGECNTI